MFGDRNGGGWSEGRNRVCTPAVIQKVLLQHVRTSSVGQKVSCTVLKHCYHMSHKPGILKLV